MISDAHSLYSLLISEPKKVSKSKIDLFDTEASDDNIEDQDADGEDKNCGDSDKITSTSNRMKIKKVGRMNSEDEINAFRNRLQIKAKGNDVPNPAATFSDMKIFPDLKPIIIANIEESTWKEPTPIQMQAITVMLEGIVSAMIMISIPI